MTEKDIRSGHMKSWLWVLLFAGGIYTTAPLARGIQRYIYSTLGSDFFTYLVLFAIVSLFSVLFYLFLFKFNIRSAAQYIWMAVIGGLYIYFTLQLRRNPEEAVHLLEYGLLALLVFHALSHKIHDNTIYASALLIASFFGLLEECIQWLLPSRVWDYKDVAVNAVGGGLSIIALGKGIRPRTISSPVRRSSLTLLAGLVSIQLIAFGLCLSNTPEAVAEYSTVIKPLSWLQEEESMTEYGFRHNDLQAGPFYSRFALRELKDIDSRYGESYGKLIFGEESSEDTYRKLLERYTPFTDAFLYEFLIHLSRRDAGALEFTASDSQKGRASAYKENILLETYYGNTLKYSGHTWPPEESALFGNPYSALNEDYISRTGKLITRFSIKTVWPAVLFLLAVVWSVCTLWGKRISAG